MAFELDERASRLERTISHTPIRTATAITTMPPSIQNPAAPPQPSSCPSDRSSSSDLVRLSSHRAPSGAPLARAVRPDRARPCGRPAPNGTWLAQPRPDGWADSGSSRRWLNRQSQGLRAGARKASRRNREGGLRPKRSPRGPGARVQRAPALRTHAVDPSPSLLRPSLRSTLPTDTPIVGPGGTTSKVRIGARRRRRGSHARGPRQNGAMPGASDVFEACVGPAAARNGADGSRAVPG